MAGAVGLAPRLPPNLPHSESSHLPCGIQEGRGGILLEPLRKLVIAVRSHMAGAVGLAPRDERVNPHSPTYAYAYIPKSRAVVTWCSPVEHRRGGADMAGAVGRVNPRGYRVNR